MISHNYLSELFSLDGRVAVVTGGSSGIGRAIAEALARAGASVVIVARKESELAATVDDLAADGCRAAWVSADLSTRDGVRAAAEQAAEVFGEPDILVNSAGINLRPPMGELGEEVWDATMAVNLEAPYLLGRRFGPGMAERGFGRIIHITSQQAHRAFVQSGAYGVSKGALESLARSGGGVVATRRHLQHAGARLRHDPAQCTVVVRPGEGGGAGRAHDGRAQRPGRGLRRSIGVPGQPRIRLRHRAGDLRRRRVLRSLSSTPHENRTNWGPRAEPGIFGLWPQLRDRS